MQGHVKNIWLEAFQVKDETISVPPKISCIVYDHSTYKLELRQNISSESIFLQIVIFLQLMLWKDSAEPFPKIPWSKTYPNPNVLRTPHPKCFRKPHKAPRTSTLQKNSEDNAKWIKTKITPAPRFFLSLEVTSKNAANTSFEVLV